MNDDRPDLSDSLSKDQRSGEDPFAHKFREGEFAAVFTAQKWSRCLILELTTDKRKALVECVDDGTRHTVHLSKLERLLPVFKKMPRYAFRCEMSQDAWNTDSLLNFDHARFSEFKEALYQQQSAHCIQVDVVEVKQTDLIMSYVVKLMVDGIDFTKRFQKKTQKWTFEKNLCK